MRSRSTRIGHAVRGYNIRVRPRFVDLLSLRGQLGRSYIFPPPFFLSFSFFSLFLFPLSPPRHTSQKSGEAKDGAGGGRRGDWIESIWKFDRRKTRKVHYQFLDRNRIAAHVEYKYIFLPISVSMGNATCIRIRANFPGIRGTLRQRRKIRHLVSDSIRPPRRFSITRYDCVCVCVWIIIGEFLEANTRRWGIYINDARNCDENRYE